MAVVPSVVRAEAKPSMTIAPIDVPRGEDGAGRLVKADAPHAIDLKSDGGWLVRAVDPVLHIGGLHFHDYAHIDRTTLRFVVDDVRRLAEGARVYVQYGEDTRTRVRFPALVKTW